MKNKLNGMKKISLTPITFALLFAWGGTLLPGSLRAATQPPLVEGEAEAILFMKQEEKLARDVYLKLGEQWRHRTFQNISKAEQSHMDSVDTLIAAYDLEDTTPEEIGEFTIPELQELYDVLLQMGDASLEAALRVGVLVEETDIIDLERLLAETENDAITEVMTRLVNGSYHHWDAFAGSLEQLGVTVEPTLMHFVKDGQLRLSWRGEGFKLQQNPRPADPNGWTDVPDAGPNSATVPLTESALFFRLKK
jgi:hypothetical protein